MTQPRQSGSDIDFQKIYMERVNIRVTAPEEPGANVSGGELLHGFLCGIYRLRNKSEDIKNTVDALCHKWHVYYIEPSDTQK